MKRELRDDQHGTPTGYTYGCRCEECTWAHAADDGKRRNARRPEGAPPIGEVREWGRALGLPVGGSKLPGWLVTRWNREHPDRLLPEQKTAGRFKFPTDPQARANAREASAAARHNRTAS